MKKKATKQVQDNVVSIDANNVEEAYRSGRISQKDYAMWIKVLNKELEHADLHRYQDPSGRGRSRKVRKGKNA